MANESNLIPFSQRTPEERKAMAAKGNETIARNKKLRSELQFAAKAILSMPPAKVITNSKGKFHLKDKIKEMFPEFHDGALSNRTAILYILMRASLKGNMRAVEILLNLAGEYEPAQDSRKPPDYKQNLLVMVNQIMGGK